MSAALKSLRAAEHREFISPLFGGPPADGEDPPGLTYMQILANPKLAELGGEVYSQLQAQFADDGDLPQESFEQARYRRRLEGWAQMLEIMLDEVLNELEAMAPARPVAQSELI